MTEIGLLALAAIVVFLAILATTKRGIGTLPVRAAPLMTKRERIVCAMIERAVPHARVHAQVSMGAILRPARGFDRSRSTSVRNRFSSKRVDFVLEDRASGGIIAIVELDDRTHDRSADRQRDRMTARAGYLTIRLGPIRHTFDTVRQALAEGLA
jgi:hypothetical protein